MERAIACPNEVIVAPTHWELPLCSERLHGCIADLYHGSPLTKPPLIVIPYDRYYVLFDGLPRGIAAAVHSLRRDTGISYEHLPLFVLGKESDYQEYRRLVFQQKLPPASPPPEPFGVLSGRLFSGLPPGRENLPTLASYARPSFLTVART